MKILAKYTNGHSRFVVVNGSLIHYRDEGTGPPLLLLHGVFSSLHTFDAWTKTLAKKFRVLRIDLPGFGLSQVTPSHEYSMKSYLSCLKEFLRLLGVGQCHIAGNSFGGWLAWEFTLKYPKIIDKLILIDAAGYLEDKYIPLPIKMARTPIVKRIIKYVVPKTWYSSFCTKYTEILPRSPLNWKTAITNYFLVRETPRPFCPWPMEYLSITSPSFPRSNIPP